MPSTTPSLPSPTIFLQTLLEKADSVIYSYQLPPNAKLEYISPEVEKMTGYTPAAFYENNNLLPQILHTEDREQLYSVQASVLESPGLAMVCRLWRKDSALVWLQHINLPILDEQGSLVKIQGIVRDITATKQLEFRDYLIKEVALMVMEDKPLSEILLHVCQEIIDIYGLNFSWTGMKKSDGSVSIDAAAGYPSPWPSIRELTVRWDESPEGRGVGGKVIRSSKTIIVDMKREVFSPWYERLTLRNIKSVAAFPLKTKGNTLGVLGIYSTYEDFFTSRIIHEIEDFAEQIALAINDAITKQNLMLVTAGLNSAVNAVVITDQNFEIQWNNQAFLDLVQPDMSSVLNKYFNEIVPPSAQNIFLYSSIHEAVLARSTWQGEIELPQRNNGIIPAEMIVSFVKDEQQKPSHFIFVLHDLTHRKQAEAALQRYQLLYELAHDIILIVRPDGRIIEANPTAIRAYGYSKEQLLTMNVNANFEPDSNTIRKHFSLSDIAYANTGIIWETQHHCKDGSAFPVEVSSVSAVIGGEQVVFSMIRDITDRKQAELHKLQVKETLAQAEKLSSLGRMAASISHEINQPLNSIKVVTDSIQYWQRKGINAEVPELMNAIQNISAQADKIDKVIKHVRAFLHGKNAPVLAPFQLNIIIESAANFLDSQLHSHGVQLKKDLAVDLPPVLGTPTGLEEIIINLVINALNALKSTKKRHKFITISTMVESEMVLMTISDNGPGIADDMKDQIFEPFFSPRESEGMGLGLSIVKSIIASYNGSIKALTNEQGGATFRVELPSWRPDRKEDNL